MTNRFQPPKMLKYVKTCQNNRPYTPVQLNWFEPAAIFSHSKRFPGEFVCSSRRPPAFRFNTYVICFGVSDMKWNSLERIVLNSIDFRTGMPTGVFSIISFQYLYCLLWPKPTVKWNSLERVVLDLTGRDNRAVKFRFYVILMFTSWWRALLTSRHIRW